MARSTPNRKRQILDEAISIIDRDGADALTMSKLAAAVGVSEAALYRHFPSKAAIALAAAEQLGRWVAATFDGIAALETPVPSRLHELTRAFDRFAGEHGTLAAFSASTALGGDPAVKATLRGVIRDVRARLTALLREGVKRGEIRGDVDLHAAAVTIHACMVGSNFLRRTSTAPDLATRRASWSIIVDALRSRRRR